MSLRELYGAIKALREKEQRDSADRWAIMRIQTTYVINLFVKKTIKPEELFLLPGERVGTTPKPLNNKEEEALKDFSAKWDKIMS